MRERAKGVTPDLKSLAPLLARITLATAFWVSGRGKLQHLSKDAAYFKSLGIPAPELMAPFVASLEVACGSLLGAGLFTRVASLPLMPIMAVALATARRKEFHSFSELTGIPDFTYLIILAYLLAYGGGNISLDALLKRMRSSIAQSRTEIHIQSAA